MLWTLHCLQRNGKSDRYKILSLYNKIEKTYIKKGKILERARYTKYKWFATNYYVNKNERKKYTLFDLTHLLKIYINYRIDSSLTYSFYLYYECCANFMKVQGFGNLNIRTARRSRRNRK